MKNAIIEIMDELEGIITYYRGVTTMEFTTSEPGYIAGLLNSIRDENIIEFKFDNEEIDWSEHNGSYLVELLMFAIGKRWGYKTSHSIKISIY